MEITPIHAFTDNYIWIIKDIENLCVCVDPGQAEPVLAYLKQINQPLTHILITHHHQDHTGGINQLLKHFPKLIIYGPADSRIPTISHIVSDNDVFNIGALQFKTLVTPGHTHSHVCFYELNQHIVFTGDTLFSAGCGRAFEESYETLLGSLLKLKSLPNDTKVYCGHEYTKKNLEFAMHVEPNNTFIKNYYISIENEKNTLPSNIALEKQINPFLKTNDNLLTHFADTHHIPLEDALKLFTKLRQLKDAY